MLADELGQQQRLLTETISSRRKRVFMHDRHAVGTYRVAEGKSQISQRVPADSIGLSFRTSPRSDAAALLSEGTTMQSHQAEIGTA